MSKQLGLAVAAGLASAVLFVSVLNGSVLLLLTTYLAPLPLFAAGLGLGVAAAVVAAMVAVIAVLAVTGTAAALPFAATTVVPAVVVVRQALLWRQDGAGKAQWYPPGLLLGWLTGLAAAGLVVAALLAPDHGEGIEGLVREYLDHAASAMPGVEAELRDAVVRLWVPLLPGLLVTVWLLVAVLNAILAQWALTRAGRNLRPTPAYQSLELPPWVAGALVVAVVGAVLAGGDLGYVAQNLAVLLLVPYVLLGLAWVHGALRRRANGGMLLALFYGLFFVVFGWAVLIVAGLGLVRHWTMLRRRMAGGSQEEE